MPRIVNADFDALIVILDESSEEEPSFFKREVGHVFGRQKVIYYKNTKMDVQELYRDILQKIQNHEVLLPPSQRIIFCCYLDLNNVTTQWMEAYQKRMDGFKNLALVRNRSQHYHVTFYKYRTVNPLGEKAEEIHKILKMFWNPVEPFEMSHAEFLLYAGGFNTLDEQEKGAVRLLKILSMRDYTSIYNMNNFENALYVLAYDDYYEERALICQEKIREIDDWIHRSKDQDMSRFYMETRSKTTAMIDLYRENMRKFKRWAGLYPVSIREYSPHGFGPFRKFTRSERMHPELEKEKESYKSHYIEELESSGTREEWEKKLEETMNYPDYLNLKDKWQSGSIGEQLRRMIEESLGRSEDGDIEMFERTFKEWIENFQEEKNSNLGELKEEKENEKTQLSYEMAIANNFSNTQECFQRIKRETEFQVPPVIQVGVVGEIAMINGEVGSEWSQNGYQIEGINDNNVLIMDEISPSQVQYIKLGKFISFNTPDTDRKMQLVLS